MADLTAHAPRTVDEIRMQYTELTRRKRLYGGVLLVLFIAMMAAGFRTADDRNAGSFYDGIHRILDYPGEVLAEASQKAAELPGHMVHFFPALIETLNIAGAATLLGAIGGTVLSLLSMFVGAVAAIGQRDIKRRMAYSSIAHMGYALMGLASGTVFGVQAMLIYMAIYVTMNIGTFAFILSMERDGQPVTDIRSLNMYAKAQPGRALAMLILLFSLAGVPPLLGFFGKLYVLRAAYEGGLAWLAVAGVVASVIGAFYYLRIVFYMYFGEEGEALETGRSPVQWAFLMTSAAIMLVGIINMFGVEAIAQAAAATLVN